MEKLIDDCIILDYGKILIQKSVSELMDTFKKFTFKINNSHNSLPADDKFFNPVVYRGNGELFSFQNTEYVEQYLNEHSIEYSQLKAENLNLEDIFIGLTGKY
jgi:ABC-2 type transport system ATP-binding protein